MIVLPTNFYCCLHINLSLPHNNPILFQHWIKHVCDKCRTRLVVLDGDAKAYRIVCAFDVKKVVKKGELNRFEECSETPLPGKDRCAKHLSDKVDNDVQGE